MVIYLFIYYDIVPEYTTPQMPTQHLLIRCPPLPPQPSGVAASINSHLASLQTIEAMANLSYTTIIIYINMNIPRLLYFYKGGVFESVCERKHTIDTQPPDGHAVIWLSLVVSKFVHILHSS